MRKPEVPNDVPIVRLVRINYHGDKSIRDLPFDETKHDWPVFLDDGLIVQQSNETEHSLAQSFHFIENGLLADNAHLIDEAIRKDLKISGDVAIRSLRVTLIQAGAQQGIFKIDCKIWIADINDELEIPLIVGISRHPALNDFVSYDHRTIIESRAREANAHGMNIDDPDFKAKSFFPCHFGEYEKDGVYFYIAEFLDSYRELNLFYTGSTGMFGDPEKIFILNGLNLGKGNYLTNELDTSRILAKIAMQQVTTALRCRLVLCPLFIAGDYLYDLEKDRVVLHCIRQAMVSPSGFWGDIYQDVENEPNNEVNLVCYQFLQLLFWQEDNLHDDKVPLPQDKYFVFSVFDIVRNLGDLIKEVGLTDKQWLEVIDLMDFWRKKLPSFINSPECHVLEKRIGDLQVMLHAQLSINTEA